MTKAELNLAVLEGLTLSKGAHSPDGEYCLWEAVAAVAGEPWTDRPACGSPLLIDYGQKLNDEMPDALRQELVPLIPMLVGTRGDVVTEGLRAAMLTNWYIREHLPALLRHADLPQQADALAALPAVTEENAQAAVTAVQDAAWDVRAAWAARDAWDAWAAWDAWDARDAWAARAARAAWDARAAWAATFDLTAQARAKAQGIELTGDTIGAIMAPVVEEMWRSQIALFRRLIEAGPHGEVTP